MARASRLLRWLVSLGGWLVGPGQIFPLIVTVAALIWGLVSGGDLRLVLLGALVALAASATAAYFLTLLWDHLQGIPLKRALRFEAQTFNFSPLEGQSERTHSRLTVHRIVLTNRSTTESLSLDFGIHLRTERGWLALQSDQADDLPLDIGPTESRSLVLSFTLSEVLLAPIRARDTGAQEIDLEALLQAGPPEDRSVDGNSYRLLVIDRIRNDQLRLKVPGTFPEEGEFIFGVITPDDEL